MTKSELIATIADESGLTKTDTDRFLKAFTATVEGALKKGDSVAMIGFGTFSVSERAARTGRNPQNPDQILQIPASKGVRFKTGSKLKQALN